MKKISILGCGWLGLPLAETLLKHQFEVKGSTTSTDKINLLQQKGISPFEIVLTENNVIGDFKNFIADSEILIIDVPPKLRGTQKENFVAKINHFIPFVEQTSVQKVLFISSTSVYGDDNTIITEASLPKPDTEAGIQLLATEALLQNNTNFKTTILRFGGLIGHDRHPVRFLAGRENIENPEAPINLIHQEDCIAIILKIITADKWDTTFNAVAPYHPSRQKYYSDKAIALGLEKPVFNNLPSHGKTIDSSKLITELNYQFIKTESI